MSTLIDLGSSRKKLWGHQNYTPPRYAYFRACLKKIWGPPFTDFLGAPPKGLPPPGKIPAGAHASEAVFVSWLWYYWLSVTLLADNFVLVNSQ